MHRLLMVLGSKIPAKRSLNNGAQATVKTVKKSSLGEDTRSVRFEESRKNEKDASKVQSSPSSSPEATYFPWMTDYGTSITQSEFQILKYNNRRALDPMRDNHFLIVPKWTTFSALLENAKLLQIDCKNPSPQPGIFINLSNITQPPPSLYPVPVQQLIPHRPYLDVLPLPSVRSRLLEVSLHFGCTEFWFDMIDGFTIWGQSPWEEMGWEVSESFVRKWWFLVDKDVIKQSNFWRAQRGLAALELQARGEFEGRELELLS
jgi:hypothetical protein